MIPINKPTIVRKDLEYVLNCLITERLEEGELAHEFEKAVAHFINVKYSLVAGSFTSAMHLALMGLDIQPEDEVIVSAYTDAPVINAVNYLKAKPVLVDIEMDTYNMDFDQTAKLISNKTKAIIVNHNFGIPADLDKFLGLNIPVIEDCSYGLSAEYNSEMLKTKGKAGSFGAISVFSFDTDTIITTGNGGMILSSKKDYITKIKTYKYNPFQRDTEYQIQYDYRMPDIAAALGLSQFKILPKLQARRMELAAYYNERFIKSAKFKIYKQREDKMSVYSKYNILFEGNLDTAVAHCRKNRIDVKKPVAQPAFLLLGSDEKAFPNSAHCFHKLMEIPVYPSLKKKEAEKIADILLKVL